MLRPLSSITGWHEAASFFQLIIKPHGYRMSPTTPRTKSAPSGLKLDLDAAHFGLDSFCPVMNIVDGTGDPVRYR